MYKILISLIILSSNTVLAMDGMHNHDSHNHNKHQDQAQYVLSNLEPLKSHVR